MSMAMSKERMLDEDLKARGITPRIVDVFSRIPRERFVPRTAQESAFADHPIPIGYGQTISQPYIVAYMMQELDVGSEDRVLEVGSGSGYVVALLSLLCKEVVGVEKVPELVLCSKKILEGLEKEKVIIGNYEIIGVGDRLGAPEQAPFDKIVVSAAAPQMPQELVAQLTDGGVMVIPVGTDVQWLWKVTKHGTKVKEERLDMVRFVPLL